jgi:hypothetical protein
MKGPLMSKKNRSRPRTQQDKVASIKPIEPDSALYRLLALIAHRIVANSDASTTSDEIGAKMRTRQTRKIE